MIRRIHVTLVCPGEILLEAREAHHVRDVLRLGVGTPVEIFDDAGNIGSGLLKVVSAGEVIALVDTVSEARADRFRFVIASAIPKAARADWMIEKLTELGADAFVPLATERSVVLPEGKNKLERWERLAAEASKQSRRRGVMRIGPLTPLNRAIEEATLAGDALHLSTESGAASIRQRVESMSRDLLTLFIGPEGGWSPQEAESFARLGVAAVSLTATILRVETAAIAAAAVVATILFNRPRRL